MAHGHLYPHRLCRRFQCFLGFSQRNTTKHIDPLLYFRHSMSRASTQARTSIVESQSKYLDVGFDVPSGGAFRVLDVIVTEAPRFSAGN